MTLWPWPLTYSPNIKFIATTHDWLSLWQIIISSVLVLTCGQTDRRTHRHTDADDRYSPATTVGVSKFAHINTRCTDWGLFSGWYLLAHPVHTFNVWLDPFKRSVNTRIDSGSHRFGTTITPTDNSNQPPSSIWKDTLKWSTGITPASVLSSSCIPSTHHGLFVDFTVIPLAAVADIRSNYLNWQLLQLGRGGLVYINAQKWS